MLVDFDQGRRTYVNQRFDWPMSALPSRKSSADRASGTVRWYDERRGFGYIIPDVGRHEGSEDVFLHAEELLESGLDIVISGQRVRYQLDNAGGSRCAVNISLAPKRVRKAKVNGSA